MARFRTEYEAHYAGTELGIDRPVAAVGSCFSANISARMRRSLWKATDPMGTLFNPLSIAKVLELALFPEESGPSCAGSLFADSLFEVNGTVHSWLLDSSFSAPSRQEVERKFLEAAERLRDTLERGKTLILTFGTARCYFIGDKVVANCHKQPSGIFLRRRVTTSEILGVWNPLMERLEQEFPGLETIFTVSPVRHVRDGFEENSLSKATLLLAEEEICRGHESRRYFPAYEILNDDLRDYRFYASDMAHPSEEAVEYIWEKFTETFVSPSSLAVLLEGEKIARRLAHRPNIDNEEALRFREETERLHKEFCARHPEAL